MDLPFNSILDSDFRKLIQNMSHSRFISKVFIGALLLLPLHGFSQKTTPPPDHRFAIRLNLIGLASFNPIAEFEYRVSKRLGLFVGGGTPDPLIHLGGIDWFNPHWNQSRIAGAYLGANIAIPIWKFDHLSIKPMLASTFYGQYDSLSHSIDTPWPTYFLKNSFEVCLNIGYAQPLGSHFFVEPVIGLGATFGVFTGTVNGFRYGSLQVPVQLNLGFRF